MKSNPMVMQEQAGERRQSAGRNAGTIVQYMDPTVIEEMCSGGGIMPPRVHHRASMDDESPEDRLLCCTALSLLLFGILVRVGRRYERRNELAFGIESLGA